MPTFRLDAAGRFQPRQRIADQGALVFLAHRGSDSAIHVRRMADDLVTAILHCVDQFRIAFGYRCIDRETRLDARGGERIEHAEHRNAVAVIPHGIMAEVRIRCDHMAGRAEWLVFRRNRVPLQVHEERNSDRFVFRPADGPTGVDA